MTWELVVVLVSMAAAVCGIVFSARSNERADNEMMKKDAMCLARIEEKLDGVNRGIEEIRVEVRTHGNQIADLTSRIARCDESIKNAHKRIDRISEGGEKK